MSDNSYHSNGFLGIAEEASLESGSSHDKWLRVYWWQIVTVLLVFVLGVGVSLGLAYWIVRVNEDLGELQVSNKFEATMQVFDDVWGELLAGSLLLATYVEHAFYADSDWNSDSFGPSREAFSEMSKVLLSVLPVATFRYAMAFNESQKLDFVARSSVFYRTYFDTPNKTYWLSGIGDNSKRTFNYTSPSGEYLVMHFIEPIRGNENSINLDITGVSGRKEWIDKVRASGTPALNDPFVMFRLNVVASSIFVPVPGRDDFILTLVRFRDVLDYSSQEPLDGTNLLLFDTTNPLAATLLGSTAKEPRTIEVVGTPQNHEMVRSAQTYRSASREIGTRTFELYFIVDKRSTSYTTLTAILVGVLGSLSTLGLCIVLILKFGRQHVVAEAQMLHAKWAERAKVERAASNFIAHEVRNPLSVAITAMKHIREDNSQVASDERENRTSVIPVNGNAEVELVEASLSYIDDLLRNVLDLNKIHRERRIDLNSSVFSIREKVLCQVQKMLDLRTENVQLNVHCNDPLWVETDRLRVQQVVMNLAKNACKFTQTGFINLSAERKSPEVIMISVADSGLGIPLDKRKDLFQPYANINGVQAQGTGIGLSICKLLVEAMNGTIRIDEKYDSYVEGHPGVRFIVELPLRDKSSSVKNRNLQDVVPSGRASAEDNVSQQQPMIQGKQGADDGEGKCSDGNIRSVVNNGTSGGGSGEETRVRRVLVVDDEPLVRMITLRHLERCLPEGWAFEECTNGAEALKLSEAKHFDVFLIDHYMNHELTGEMTIRKLREAGSDAVIIGYSANDVSKQHVQAGANEFWGKPLPSKEKLVGDINRLIGEQLLARAEGGTSVREV